MGMGRNGDGGGGGDESGTSSSFHSRTKNNLFTEGGCARSGMASRV